MMWVVISITKNEAAAKAAREILTEEGLLAETRPMDKKKETGFYEILVLESEALEARDILTERGMV